MRLLLEETPIQVLIASFMERQYYGVAGLWIGSLWFLWSGCSGTAVLWSDSFMERQFMVFMERQFYGAAVLERQFYGAAVLEQPFMERQFCDVLGLVVSRKRSQVIKAQLHRAYKTSTGGIYFCECGEVEEIVATVSCESKSETTTSIGSRFMSPLVTFI